MLTARKSMAFGKRRYHHAVDSQILQAECRADDIHDRINRTDFMEMNLADRDSVCLGLCLRHNLKHPARQIFNTVGCIQTIDDLENVVDVAVDVRMHMIVGVSVTVVMAMLMIVRVLMIVMVFMVVLIMAMFLLMTVLVVVRMLFFL